MRLRGQTPNRARADTQLVRPRAQLPSAAVRVRPRASRTRRPPSVHAPPESPPRLPKQFTDTHTQSSVPSARYATAAPSSRRLSQPLRFGLARENTWALSRLRGAHLPRSVCNFRFRFGFGGTLFSLFRLRGAHLPRSVCNFRFGCGPRKHAAALAYPTHVTVSLLCVSSLPDLKGPCHRGAHPPWSLVGSARCAVPVRQFLTLSHLGAPSNPHPKPPAGHPSPRGRTLILLGWCTKSPQLSPSGWLGQISLSPNWLARPVLSHLLGVDHYGSHPGGSARGLGFTFRASRASHAVTSRQTPSSRSGLTAPRTPVSLYWRPRCCSADHADTARNSHGRSAPERAPLPPAPCHPATTVSQSVRSPQSTFPLLPPMCVCVPNARLAAYARSH